MILTRFGQVLGLLGGIVLLSGCGGFATGPTPSISRSAHTPSSSVFTLPSPFPASGPASVVPLIPPRWPTANTQATAQLWSNTTVSQSTAEVPGAGTHHLYGVVTMMGQAYRDGILVSHYDNVTDNLGFSGQWAWQHGRVALNADVQQAVFVGPWTHLTARPLPISAVHALPAWTATGTLSVIWAGARHLWTGSWPIGHWSDHAWSALPSDWGSAQILQTAWQGTTLMLVTQSLTHPVHTTLWTFPVHHAPQILIQQAGALPAWVNGSHWALLRSPTQLITGNGRHVQVTTIHALPPVPVAHDTLACTPSRCLVGVMDSAANWDSAAPPNSLWQISVPPVSHSSAS